MLKNMFREAGIFTDGKSNHSLRATATTRMIDAGLPEKVIMDRTGHHSLDGLKPYSRTTDRQQQQMSAVISCSELMIKDKETTVEKKEEIEKKVKGAVNYYGEMKGCVFKVGREDKMSLSEHESYIFISEDMNVIKPLLQKSHQKYIALVEVLRIHLILFERINLSPFYIHACTAVHYIVQYDRPPRICTCYCVRLLVETEIKRIEVSYNWCKLASTYYIYVYVFTVELLSKQVHCDLK